MAGDGVEMADPELQSHREWLGYVQPVGVVVSPPALVATQAYVNRNVAPLQQLLLDVVEETQHGVVLPHFPKFVTHVFRWDDGDLVDAPPELECALPEYGEVLRATYAVREPEPPDRNSAWMMLLHVLPDGGELDAATAADDRGWQASPQAKFERLLRETRVPIGLLTNGTHIRLVYAPRGETSGHITFPLAAMTEVAGRPILAALEMLVCADRLFTLPREQRLPAILADSRRYQNDVSTRLAGQVLAGLYELLRGFQAADDHAHGELLRGVLREKPDLVYEGLLTVLLRLVFLLYAEDRDLMPGDDVYVRHYSVGGLFERLRADAGRYPDTMDLRYGAWTQLLSLFRIVFDGVRFGGLRLPARQGHLFDPDRFAFLEGRPHGVLRVMGDRIDAPLVSDGVVWRVLQNLVVLDGERLSYRSLDVEQIGSVYETMMGFRLEIARGHSLALKPVKTHGAPITINVDELLDLAGSKRAQWVRENGEQKLTTKEASALACASTIEDVEAAIERKIDRRATPAVVPAGGMILQPNEERRRSGSFYTPRSLTEPIVRTTLRPILDRLGDNPAPEAVLDLKLCDPAMGSGAFLVEACRQLADTLVDAWHAHDCIPATPPDSDELLHARRLVAHRCLYGVDKNPIAVDLAKLSLWLATLARDHPFTFVDHALRCGDSLVGLTRDQIVAFHWQPSREKDFITRSLLQRKLDEAEGLRAEIHDAGDEADVAMLRHLLRAADDALDDLRLAGDLVILAFFSGGSQRQRQGHRDRLAEQVWAWQQGGESITLRQLVDEMRTEQRVTPFHWEIEFPEVFGSKRAGFDAIVGNPPFLGGSIISRVYADPYSPYLKELFTPGLKGRVDLVAYFLLRSVQLLGEEGTAGLLATAQAFEGDAKRILGSALPMAGGYISNLDDPRVWPGEAAVYFRAVFLEPGPGREAAEGKQSQLVVTSLQANRGIAWRGTEVRGEGFIISEQERLRLLSADPENAQVISPYMNGKDLNSRPDMSPGRWIINFGTMPFAEASRFIEPFRIVTELVEPERRGITKQIHESDYWKYWDKRLDSYERLQEIGRCLALSAVTASEAVSWVEAGPVYQNKLILFLLNLDAAFSILQSRCHWLWVRQNTASRGPAGLNYSPTHCFETFPLPHGWEKDVDLNSIGKTYYEFRSALMLKNQWGLTPTYSRFHDPNERGPEITRLRQLHSEMDVSVLAAYGWGDIPTACEFLVDREQDKDDDNSIQKKSWRYRWPDEVRDEVLARLLALNVERAEEERLQLGDRTTKGRSKRAATPVSEPVLFEEA